MQTGPKRIRLHGWINRLLMVLLLVGVSHVARADAVEDLPTAARVDVSAGVGLAYEVAGLNLGVRFGHVEPYLGMGLFTMAGGVQGGVRFFSSSSGRGFTLAIHGGSFVLDGDGNDFPNRVFGFGLTAGGRFQPVEHLFVDLAFGGALDSIQYDRYPKDSKVTLVPNVDVAVGFEL